MEKFVRLFSVRRSCQVSTACLYLSMLVCLKHTSDDDEALERKDLDQKIGKIILEIQRVKFTGSKRLNKMETLRNI